MRNDLDSLLRHDGFVCACGKRHFAGIREAIIAPGAALELPRLVRRYGGRAFVLADENTLRAGAAAIDALRNAGVPTTLYCFPGASPEPDERAVGAAMMHYDHACDVIVGIGSGVINDIGKILAAATRRPYLITATAPSMDGYASATSSVIREGLKVSLPSRCPDVIVADPDILCKAPRRMLAAGVGDMLAKYVSICEWRISHLITGEYYCETVADIVRQALQNCVEQAPRLMARDPAAVKAVMEGMVIAGVAMNYAGISRPASGVEHYLSHIWDMRALAFHAPSDLHGIQVGAAVPAALRAFDYVDALTPDREKALSSVRAFDYHAYCDFLQQQLGAGARAMIDSEKRDGKYDPQKHAERLEIILQNWEQIRAILREELPPYDSVKQLLESVGAPVSPRQFGISAKEVGDAFLMSKDIRDKYVLSRLCWDLGVAEETAAFLEGGTK